MEVHEGLRGANLKWHKDQTRASPVPVLAKVSS